MNLKRSKRTSHIFWTAAIRKIESKVPSCAYQFLWINIDVHHNFNQNLLTPYNYNVCRWNSTMTWTYISKHMPYLDARPVTVGNHRDISFSLTMSQSFHTLYTEKRNINLKLKTIRLLSVEDERVWTLWKWIRHVEAQIVTHKHASGGTPQPLVL